MRGKAGRSGGPDDLRHGVGAIEFLFDGEGRLHGFDVGESAESGFVEVGRKAFDAELAIGLETAEFGGGAEHLALGFTSGAVDGALGRGVGGIEQGVVL